MEQIVNTIGQELGLSVRVDDEMVYVLVGEGEEQHSVTIGQLEAVARMNPLQFFNEFDAELSAQEECQE